MEIQTDKNKLASEILRRVTMGVAGDKKLLDYCNNCFESANNTCENNLEGEEDTWRKCEFLWDMRIEQLYCEYT